MDSGSWGALDSKKSSCAVTTDAVLSSMGPLTQMMRSRSRREKMSNTRSPRLPRVRLSAVSDARSALRRESAR